MSVPQPIQSLQSQWRMRSHCLAALKINPVWCDQLRSLLMWILRNLQQLTLSTAVPSVWMGACPLPAASCSPQLWCWVWGCSPDITMSVLLPLLSKQTCFRLWCGYCPCPECRADLTRWYSWSSRVPRKQWIREVHIRKGDIVVLWLNLANGYCAIPHKLVETMYPVRSTSSWTTTV